MAGSATSSGAPSRASTVPGVPAALAPPSSRAIPVPRPAAVAAGGERGIPGLDPVPV